MKKQINNSKLKKNENSKKTGSKIRTLVQPTRMKQMAIWLYQTLLCLWCSLSHSLFWWIFCCELQVHKAFFHKEQLVTIERIQMVRGVCCSIYPHPYWKRIFFTTTCFRFHQNQCWTYLLLSPSRAKVWNSRFWFLWLVILNHANSSCKDRAAHSRLSTIGTWYPFSICNLGQPYMCLRTNWFLMSRRPQKALQPWGKYASAL